MFRALIAREVRRLARSPMRAGLLVVLVAASGWAVASGLAWREAKLAEQALMHGELGENRNEWFEALGRAEAGKSILPFAAQPMALGFAAVLPPGPLGDFAFGRDALHPHYTNVQGWQNAASLFKRYEVDGPTTLATGWLDLNFVVIVLMPLILVLLGFDALSRERENGRLPLMLVQGARPGAIVGARLLVVGVAVWAILAVAAAVGALRIDALERLARFGIWLVAMTAYCAFWVAIVALVAVSFRRQANAALGALGAWIALVVVVPSGAQFLAAAVYPPPSRVEMLTRARIAESAARRNVEQRAEVYMAEHPSDDAPAKDVPGFYRAAYLANLDINARTAEVLEAFHESRTSQRSLADAVQVLSPVMVAYDVLTGVAGSGFPRVVAFQERVRQHLHTVLDAIGPATVGRRRLTVEQARAIPAFVHREPPVPRAAWLWIALLITWTAVVAMFVARRLAWLRRAPL